MIVRIGIHPGERWGAALKNAGGAALVSANALRRRKGGFRLPTFGGHDDIALDSAGFVALVRYRGYPWSQQEYVALARAHPWAWWAAMDFCCEPEIAGDRDEVSRRMLQTAMMLERNRDEAEIQGVKPPMPVIQGWMPEDYLVCAEMMGELPQLVGVGSVCRRNLRGADGLLAILARLDRSLPQTTKLHLFGVKGAAIPALLGHPRIHSVDSMAWDQAARREIEPPRTVTKRIAYMLDWHKKQTAHSNLFARAS